MSKVVHQFGSYRLEKEVDNPSFLVANNTGSYASFSNFPLSRYQGVFFNINSKMFKAIENINPLETHPVTRVVNNLSSVSRERRDLREDFIMPEDMNTFIYQLSETKDIEISLDMRESYDSKEFGRYYSIETKGNKIIIEYSKKTDKREDATEGSKEYSLFLVIIPDIKPETAKIEEWCKVEYPFDKMRNSWPFERYVFKALRIKAKRLVFGFSTNLEKAESYAEDAAKKDIPRHITFKRKKESEIGMAYVCAQSSIGSLMTNINNNPGIYAGLPWFFQFWSRDELISTKSLMLMERYEDAKGILFRWMNEVRHDGLIPNRFPPSDLGSADGIGWMWKRIGDFIELLEKKNKLSEYIVGQEIYFIKNKLEKCVYDLLRHHTNGSYAINGKQETWMDTVWADDTREGARVEIQALRLNMYRLLAKLCIKTGDNIGLAMASKLEKDLRDKVRKEFWNGSILADGRGDWTIRPNIFIAYYAYPELLSGGEWSRCFRNSLPKLWQAWGGLSTIDTASPLYTDHHTGQDDKSYHRGDSWYWINNLAALCMSRVSKLRFRREIRKILDASTEEILWKGLIGHHAEISSAREMQSLGCQAQAWSAAMYIEMVEELL